MYFSIIRHQFIYKKYKSANNFLSLQFFNTEKSELTSLLPNITSRVPKYRTRIVDKSRAARWQAMNEESPRGC